MKVFLATIAVLGIWAGTAYAQTITNTVSWATEPANVESYDVEKQIGGDPNPWTMMPAGTVTPPALSFVDAGNTPGVQVCYRVTPKNTLPSSGTPAQACSITVGVVGDMPVITIVPQVIP